VVTSLNKLAAARPHSAGHSAGHVEAPDPDIIMRRLPTSDHDPSAGINGITLKQPITTNRSQRRAGNRIDSRACPFSGTLSSSGGASATAEQDASLKRSLTNVDGVKV
jgi:hypothetical protein